MFQLREDLRAIDHTRTDVFRDRVRHTVEVEARLTKARKNGRDAVREPWEPQTALGNLRLISAAAAKRGTPVS